MQMHQVAPYPDELADLVKRLRYRRHMGWSVHLDPDLERDHADVHAGPSRGLTLVVTRCGPNSYHPEQVMVVNHYFPVTPATYDLRSWQRWLFDRLGDVDTHERMEDFGIADSPGSEHVVRPYAPNHGPGNDPYRVCEYAEDIDRRTSFRGDVNGG